ncbi:thiol-disulfide oxidoreductase DCC family protein [Agrococcus casei]|uniref:Cell division inhibitor n=1 Tax=Agrococcus casei LMG 22410 TaxID=1255656 RepID=A0A1R4EYA2_9MICO|nr:DCC1-like thiol-disulfide oxidoreductase family protein [Agrococcus casei]SJM48596.1 hypothetical protein CZ674_01570 [Agrococcus casei LMG 22410]
MAPGLLIYDGDCAFCTSAVQWLEARLERFPRSIPQQHIDFAQYGLSLDDVTNSAWIVDTRSPLRMWSHGELAAALLAGQPSFALRWTGRMLALPGIRHACDLGYRAIAVNRHRLPGGTPACAMPPRA